MRDDLRTTILRSLIQRFESLRRAGVDRVPLNWRATPAATTASQPRPPANRAPGLAAHAGSPGLHPPAQSRVEGPAKALGSKDQERPKSARTVEEVLSATGSLFGDEGFDEPILPAEQRAAALESQAREVAGCTRCPHLAAARTQTVFGVGNPAARLMFIGEAPGADEDRLGEPFVGRAGQLLTDMITKGMGLKREDVYIANILKCRPPNNRDPEPGEVANCLGYLERQIGTVRPEYLCLLGRIAAQRLLDTAMPMSRLRGKWQRYRGIPTLVTYHPAYLLRNPPAKAEAWEDLKLLMRAMGLRVPERKRPRGEDAS